MADHDFDFELIMALAEGTLDPAEAEAAEARLDDTAREELAIQRMAIAAMADLPEPVMSASERISIRDAVGSELNLEPASTRPTPISPARPWYVRFMPALGAAAALVVVVGIGVSGGLGGDDDSAADAVAADAPANQSGLSGSFDRADAVEEATAAAESGVAPTAESLAAATPDASRDAAADDFAEEAADEAASDGDDDAGDNTGPEITTATEVAADDDTVDLGFRFIYVGDTITSAPGEVEEVMFGHIERTTSTPLPIEDAPAFFETELLLQCWEEAISRADEEGTALASVLIAGNGKLDGRDAEFYEFDRDPSGIIVVVAADSCEELLTVTR